MPRVYNKSTTSRTYYGLKQPVKWLTQKEAVFLTGKSITTLKRRVKDGIIEERVDYPSTRPLYNPADIYKMMQGRERVFKP